MDISRVDYGQTGSHGPGEFTPQQELKTLLETVEQIQAQMSQNGGNRNLLGDLHDEYTHTLSQIHRFALRLPSSQQDIFKSHLEGLKGQMQKFSEQLMDGAPANEIQVTHAALSTALSELNNDLGTSSTKRSFY